MVSKLRIIWKQTVEGNERHSGQHLLEFTDGIAREVAELALCHSPDSTRTDLRARLVRLRQHRDFAKERALLCPRLSAAACSGYKDG